MDESLHDYVSVREELLHESPEARELWRKTEAKRRISLMFARMRASKGLSQKDIASFAEWDKSYVSRLEGAQGGLPDLQTLTRFAEACGLTIGIVICDPNSESDNPCRVVDAVSLPPREEEVVLSRDSFKFESLRGRTIFG